VVVVEFGVNDARRGIPPATIEQNLTEMLTRIKAKGARIVLCGRRAPFPPGYDIEGYRAVFPKVGKKFGAAGCIFTAGIPPSGFQPDGHENAQGTTVVANNIARLVMPMIRK
jgi:acyl-CoA thioesterase-1